MVGPFAIGRFFYITDKDRVSNFFTLFFAGVIHSLSKASLCQAEQVFHRQVKNVQGTFLKYA